MTARERRRIMCSVTFHVIAITCVVWSLYVLIDRTAEEIKQGQATGMSRRKGAPSTEAPRSALGHYSILILKSDLKCLGFWREVSVVRHHTSLLDVSFK